jgi:hypothetical protein
MSTRSGTLPRACKGHQPFEVFREKMEEKELAAHDEPVAAVFIEAAKKC